MRTTDDDQADPPEPYASPTMGRHTGPKQSGDFRVMVKVLRAGSAARRARGVVRGVLRQAGVPADAVADAEIVVAELAANAEKHARPPYELRITYVGRVPTWCEIVDGDPDSREVHLILDHLDTLTDGPSPPPTGEPSTLLAENGRGLLMAHHLSQGGCRVYPTTILTTSTPGKAVAFPLPACSGDLSL
ncbi:ATP-binding protein [Sphaerisporangium sp. B11E5]|uniref:ATP-binding protein n=1 Tax=Sphaerisporangium sp. B11E5 TaxID=3153563 RepID=UPI00325CB210